MNNTEEEVKKPFEITDTSSLNWVFREILAPLKEKVKRTKELETAEIDRIKTWAENENRGPLQDIEYWEQRISDYHLELLRTDPKQRTISTPYGKSSSRRSGEAPAKGDEDKLLQYAKDNELTDLINVKESIRWADFKKNLEVVGNQVVDVRTGEIVEGAVVKPETVTCKVDVL